MAVLHPGKSMKEDIDYLDSFFDELQTNINKLRGIASDKDISLYFSISTLTCNNNLNKPYITPVRFLENSIICGVVIFSQIQCIVVTSIVKNIVDGLLIDIEQKHSMDIAADNDMLKLKNLNLKVKYQVDFKNNICSFDNILSIARAIASNVKIIEYKANDLTVDSIWTFLSAKFNYLVDKKIAVIGCGNIGSKLALKLVESGANVIIVRRDSVKGKRIVDAINIIKPVLSKGCASYNHSAVDASKCCDVIVGTANTDNQVITWDCISGLSKNGFIIDAGKGNIETSAIRKSIDNNIDIYRGDVSAALYGFVSQRQKMQKTLQNIGRFEIDKDLNISIVSGGFMGRNGDFVVDSITNPKIVYGVANGSGSLKITLNQTDKKNIEIVKKYIERRN